MAIVKELAQVDSRFIQPCPFCNRHNRIVMHGLFVIGDKIEKHPDMGYSFCNCRNVFYTSKDNITDPASYEPDAFGIITLPDPFFAWPNPYDFHHWDVRRYELIWPMDSYCEFLKELGYEVISAERDFDVQSKTPQHFHIKVRKP